jgi:hypothetical protein
MGRGTISAIKGNSYRTSSKGCNKAYLFDMNAITKKRVKISSAPDK